MVWRKEVFQEFKFDEWFSGYALFEDIDFSYSVSKKYKIVIVADAQLEHLNKLERMNFSTSFGKAQVLNRLYFAKKNNLSIFLCSWSLSGLFLNNIIKALSGADLRYIYRAKGNFIGFLQKALLKN